MGGASWLIFCSRLNWQRGCKVSDVGPTRRMKIQLYYVIIAQHLLTQEVPTEESNQGMVNFIFK